MQWYCKAQLFTSHQARRSQRHNMSQHAKQCELEHPRFPETKQHKESKENKKSLSSLTRAKLWQSPQYHTHTAGTNRRSFPHFAVRIAKSQIWYILKRKLWVQNIVSYGWEPRGTTVRVCQQLCGRQGNWISFVQRFVFPRRRQTQKERTQELDYKRGCSEKCERDASKLWSIQYPHLKPPFTLMLF